jgi:hypothetical protein
MANQPDEERVDGCQLRQQPDGFRLLDHTQSQQSLVAEVIQRTERISQELITVDARLRE